MARPPPDIPQDSSFMQLPDWQTSTHCGLSKLPTHSLHFLESILKTLPLCVIALFGHSLSHAPQAVQVLVSIV
jgi:hypothetical protein